MSKPSQVESLFFAALEKGTAEERAAFLDSACSGNAELRRQVEKLLNAHPRVGDFLNKPVVEQLAAAPELADATQEFDAAINGPRAAPAGRNGPSLARTEGEGSGDYDSDFIFLQPSTRPDSLGRIGHYEVLEVLGKGGFGIVFRAFDETLQRVVAIKVLAPQLAAGSPARKRFLREARSSAKVRHENVVQVYAVEEQPLPYLVLEFIPGETLQQRIHRTGPLEAAEAARIGRQIAEGLAAAHGTGLIHRDVKPGNILIEAGPHQHVKITDFGLARAADDASLTQSGFVAGTPMFMAPEQASGDKLDHRADLFSLGSVLYTMCSGRPPFRANNTVAVLKRVAEDTPRPIPEIIPETPQWLCDIITRLHAKKPEDRIGTAKEVADLLGRGLAEMQRPASVPLAAAVKMPPPQEIPEAAPAIRRPRFRIRRWAAAAAVLLLLVAGLGFTEAIGVTDFHGSVIRLFSPEGTLVVEVDDPEVSVKIDGSDVVIMGTGAKEIRLNPGNYTVEASKDGKVVSRELVAVTRNGRQVVRVSQEAAPSDVKTAKAVADASAWERSVAAMPANEQVKAVSARLKELNPGFDGKMEPTIENGVVTGLRFLTDDAANIAPVRAFKGLASLDCSGTYPRKGKLSDLSPLKGTSLNRLDCSYTQVADLAPLSGMPLKQLLCSYTQAADLAPLKGMPLVELACASTGVSDLSPLKGMKLQFLMATGIPASDLTPLQGMPLKGLDLYGTIGVTNLQPLQGMPLEVLNLSTLPVSDLSALKSMASLQSLDLEGAAPVSDAVLVPLKDCKNLTILTLKSTKVTAAGVDELKKALPNCKIQWDGGVIEPGSKADASAWERSVAAMPAEEQVKAVLARLKELNPDFDGKVEPTIDNGVVTGLGFPKEQVSDISPVRVFTKLRTMNMEQTQVSGLTPLKGMPLRYLNLYGTPASDLSPLKGMPLVEIQLMGSQVSDLSPLKGMPLEVLFCSHTRVSDLSPLKGMPLRILWINSEVSDLSPLKGMPLEHLGIGGSKVSDLSPLTGMPLRVLTTGDSQVSDLSPLKGMPLEQFGLTPKNITRGLDILRDMKSLKTIDAMDRSWPAAEFWDRYDKGEFKE